MAALLTRISRGSVAAASAALLASLLMPGAGAAAGGVSVSRILAGYDGPVLVTAPRGSSRRIYIVEQRGTIQIATYSQGSWKREGTFLDIRDRVAYPGVQGLLGLAFAPDYATSRRFYVDYTRKSDGAVVIAEFRRRATDATKACKSCFREVVRIAQPGLAHNGGMIAFGPDRMLYVGMGDGGDGSGEGHDGDVARRLHSRLGKLLRFDPRDPDGSGPRSRSVPSDNPFVDTPGAERVIWARGLRNPWRWSFDRSTGDLWIADVGHYFWEEVNVVRAAAGGRDAGKGVDFGWDRCEGTHDFEGTGCASFGVRPVVEYGHGDGGCAVTGGYVYRGPTYPAWRGRYVFADFCTGQLCVRRPSRNCYRTCVSGGPTPGPT